MSTREHSVAQEVGPREKEIPVGSIRPNFRVALFSMLAVARRRLGLFTVLIFATYGPTIRADPVCPSAAVLVGIDVSTFSGAIDWNMVAADGVNFAYIRVADGLVSDSRFSENWTGARQAGVVRGAVQVLRPEVDALTQAQLLVDAVVALAPGDLPPALEVVSTGGENAATIATSVGLWVGYVEAELGLKPVVYTSRYFWQDSVGSVDYSNYPLWIADYSSPACPNLPTQWSDWVFWQDSSTGSVSGISVAVNTDYFNGDHAALTAIGQPAQCDAEPCPLFADGFEPPVSAAVEIIASRSSR